MPERPSPAALALLAAADSHGSISAAARALGVSQPTASASLRRIERDLGLELFVRTPRGTRLTDAGRVVTECARSVLDAYEQLAAAATALRDAGEARVRIAASLTIAEHLAPRWLASLARERRAGVPTPDVELAVCNSADVMRRVLADEVELGFVESPSVRRGLRMVTVARDELVVVVAPDHPWARRRSRLVDVDELLTSELVLREEGSGTRESLVRALERAGRSLPEHLPQLGSTQALRTAVVHAGGVAVISRLAVLDDLAAGTVVACSVRGLDLARPLRAVWKDGADLGAAARRVVAAARHIGSEP
jgi:molybdate transport repressor ModE-like protein